MAKKTGYERFRPKEGIFLTEGNSFVQNSTGEPFNAYMLRPETVHDRSSRPAKGKPRFVIREITSPEGYIEGFGGTTEGTARTDFEHYARSVAFAGLAKADDARAFEQGNARKTFKELAERGKILPLEVWPQSAGVISQGGHTLVVVFKREGPLKRLYNGRRHMGNAPLETRGQFVKRVVRKPKDAFVSPVLKLPKTEPRKGPHK